MILLFIFAFLFGATGFIVGAMISIALKFHPDSWPSAILIFLSAAILEGVGIYIRCLLFNFWGV
jgi:hypothetical protein